MVWTTAELRRATQAANRLLETLGLDAYLYEIEPMEGQWVVRIECGLSSGWERRVFEVDKDRLVQAVSDQATEEALLAEWAALLVDCKRSE